MRRKACRKSETRLSDLSPSRRQLVRVMQRLHHGTIHGLHVRAGRPVFTPVPNLARAPHRPPPRPEAATEDFTLKLAVLQLLDALAALGDGVADVEVRDGLPSRWRTDPAVP